MTKYNGGESTPLTRPNISNHSTRVAELLHRPAITPKETLEILPLGRNAVYDAIRRGQIPSFRVGRKIFVPTAALLRKFGMDGGDS